MDTKEDISITVSPQEYISGSQEYSVNVIITNISGKPLINLQIFNTLSAGREISRADDIEISNLTDLEDKKRKLIRELEKGVESAYERYKLKQYSWVKLTVLVLFEFMDMYVSIFSKEKFRITIPIWAEEALRIDEWEDVERLETDVIGFESDDSFLKKAYLINKDKLKRVISKLEEENEKKFSRGVTLHPGSSTSFQYSFKAPHLLKQKKMDISFKSSYKLDSEEIVHIRAVTQKILLYPSAFSVPTGSMVGAIVGYLIKATIASKTGFAFNWGGFMGVVALGLLFGLLSSRNSDVSKWITVEDFAGGFIIGAMAGIFSDNILVKLQSLM
jgi:hypothetical protein